MPPAVEVNIKPKQINKYEFKFLTSLPEYLIFKKFMRPDQKSFN